MTEESDTPTPETPADTTASGSQFPRSREAGHHASIPDFKTPPMAADPGNPVLAILVQIDELRNMFNNIGRENDHVVDLITARLVNNSTFYERLADAVIRQTAMIKAASDNARQAQAQETAARTEEFVEGPSGERLKIVKQDVSTVTSSYAPFDGHQGYVDIVEGETVVNNAHTIIGGKLYFNNGFGDHPALTPIDVVLHADGQMFSSVNFDEYLSDEYVTTIMSAVRGSWSFVREQNAKHAALDEELLQGARFWFCVNSFTPVLTDAPE